uniref:rho GTPase-activating protein 27 isoform X3 n=1 Tax=Gasterosteus aculeatus aculeatus TaxID=481459 RepID=UPI001A97E51C|nr:rho GTPase-activating protein 27 isoform X3 [Gasterosteus aculeatus aculeatus]
MSTRGGTVPQSPSNPTSATSCWLRQTTTGGRCRGTRAPSHFTSLPTVPVAVPVAVPVPVPKTLEESRTQPGDDVMIRVRTDATKRYRKTENRMSTFGFPLDSPDTSSLSAPRHSSNPLAGAAETGTTNMADKKHLPGFAEDHRDSDKHRAPSFSPADPVSSPRNQTQPIAVEMPVVPVTHPHYDSSLPSTGRRDNRESSTEEELCVEESSSEEDPVKEEDSNHIYESIQDLNLDLEALVGGSPAAPHSPDLPPSHNVDLHQKSPIYANISSMKKTNLPQVSISGPVLPSSPPPDPAPSIPGRTPSSSASSGMISPASPLSPQDGWQVHTDRDSGQEFYFHPVTRRTTWSNPQGPPPALDEELDRSKPSDGGQRTSPLLSSQSSAGWQQLVDKASGRVYYHDPSSGTTSWAPPEPPPAPLPGAPADSPPPLPDEDYPPQVQHDNNEVFTTNPQQLVCLIPRAQLDSRDEISPQEVSPLPQRMMGNGVSEEETTLEGKYWTHTVVEETFIHGHRRNASEVMEMSNRKPSPDSPQLSHRHKVKRNLSDRSSGSQQHHGHLLEKAGIMNKTKVVDHGKKIRKNWSQSWTVLHGGILTFHKDPKSAPTVNASKTSQIVPEYTVELRGASVSRAARDKSSKKNVLELKTRQGCEYLMQYDTESIISDWLKAMQDTIRQLDHVSEDEDEATSDKEDKDRKRTTSRTSPGMVDSEQRHVRTKLLRFLQRRPTLQSVKEKGYIRDSVFGCHLDTLCQRENNTTPKFMEKCIRTVERRGLDVDGIYRVSGNLAVIQKLRHKADHEEELDLEDGQWEEIHVITGALKLFLRELPEPLFPFSCFDKFIAAIQVQDYSLRVSYMKDLVRSLPLPNHDTMELLFKHLRRVVEHKESNRMSVQSVAIVFGPTLLRPQTESSSMTIHMVFQSQIVELMLNEFQTVFSES